MQEFNKITTTSNFIKELLYQTFLPVVRTVLPGDYIIEDRIYIYKCEIIKATKSGYLQPYRGSTLAPLATFDRIGEYTFGDRNGKLCHNYQSNSAGYDSITHEKLGCYLRALRDMYDLNLMPFYNCFSNNILPNHYIEHDKILHTSKDYRTKIYKVPIRFNTDYTVCIENIGDTTIAPAFIRNNHLVRLDKTPIGNDIDTSNRYISLYTNDVVNTYANMRFFHPIKVRFNNVPCSRVKKYNVITSDSAYPMIELSDKYFQAVGFLQSGSSVNIPIYEKNTNYMYVDGDFKTFYMNTNGDMVFDDFPIRYKKVNCTADTVPKDGFYYTSTFNPAEAGWCEEIVIDDITTFSTTSDTYINTDKYYYENALTADSTYYEYDIDDTHCSMYDGIEDTLYMLIQVPEVFDSNIVILEGDYTNIQSKKIFNQKDLHIYPQAYLDKLFTRNLRLLRMNTKEKVPFSNTLIQFLLWNAFCQLDTINLNMDRLLMSLKNLGLNPGNYPYQSYNSTGYHNYWYYKYQELISDYASETEYDYIDDNVGYVTSEIESIINAQSGGYDGY